MNQVQDYLSEVEAASISSRLSSHTLAAVRS